MTTPALRRGRCCAVLEGIFARIEQDKGQREQVRHLREYRLDNLPASLFVLINLLPYITDTLTGLTHAAP